MSFHLLFKAVYQEVRPVRGTVRQTKTGKIVPVQGYAAKKLVSGNGEEEFEKKQKYIEAAKRTIDEKPEERRDDSAGMAFRDAVTKMPEEGRRETWSDVRAKKIREGKDIQSATAAADFLLSQGVAREDFPQRRATNPRGKNQNV